MADPNVSKVGGVHDLDGRWLEVGADYDSVTVGEYRLERQAAEEFARLFIAACWEAADNARLMAEEAAT